MKCRIAAVYLAALVTGCGATQVAESARDPDGGVVSGPGGGGGGGPGGQPDAGSPAGSFYPVRPSPITTENQLPSSSGLRLSNYNPALGAYTDRTSYVSGDTVSVRAAFAGGATSGTWELWRMGYYGGARGRLVSSGGQVPVQAQPANVVDPTTGAVSAPWAISFTFIVP